MIISSYRLDINECQKREEELQSTTAFMSIYLLKPTILVIAAMKLKDAYSLEGKL